MRDLWGILFPHRCPVCDGLLRFGGADICASCYHRLTYIVEPRCKKCGKQMVKWEEEYCFDCRKQKHLYEQGIALLRNKGEGKKSVYAIKYRNKREYAGFYAGEIGRRYGREIALWEADCLVPVPLHRRKKLQRGYNQAEVIADRLSKVLGLPVQKKLLKRNLYTRPQKELNDTERKKNLEKAFIVTENVVKLKKVILVDDIYTTGSTIDACAGVLRKAGIEKVYYISLSIGDGY